MACYAVDGGWTASQAWRAVLKASITRTSAVILLPTHPASFAHKFLFQRVPGCNSIADLSLKIVFRTHKFAVGTH